MGSTQPPPLPPATSPVYFSGGDDNDYKDDEDIIIDIRDCPEGPANTEGLDIDAANTDGKNVDHLVLLPDEKNGTAIGDNNNGMSLNQAV